MTTNQLKSIFEKDYNREDWRSALQEIFHIKTLYAIPNHVEIGANDFEAEAVELGNFETAEGLQVGLYEVSISPEKHLDRNKVELRNLMRKVYQNDGDAALIVFTQGHTWRFTYASELTTVNKETGERERKQTDPKRYTYVLGKNRHCRTAIERFSCLKVTTDLFNEYKISIEEIEKAFSVETLTKQFYKELFDWYQWALSDNDGFAVTYPNDTSIASDDRKIDEHIIRLITRLMFVWFIKQKNLVPNQIFEINSLKSILKKFDPYSKIKGNYYNAILQNFFFATLNKPIDERAFAEDGDYDDRRKHYGIKTYFRNPKGESWFKISNEEIIKIFSKVPFLNGGLFECLDKSADSNGKIIYHDGFSREERVRGKLTRAFIPNCLFFDTEKGLIPLLEKYNFTIEESTPIDVEVALDPELLGKVFENLLGAFNPETKDTARKQSGSFYTPREIVNYMVNESLIDYLNTKCPEIAEDRTRSLFIHDNESFEFNETERTSLISALKSVKIIDPACGSGAFPMGVLNKMVDLLQKLEDVEAKTPYEQKLHLIENCIYGIDIQTIAVQISKLRFFISLVSDQITNSKQEDNYGIRPLPNLETKFVAANTLIGLEKDFTDRLDLGFTEIRDLKDQLWKIRSQHFSARNAKEKKDLRDADEILRKKIQTLLVEITSKPDVLSIERLQSVINALRVEKELYQGENFIEILEPSLKQGVLFDTLNPNEQLTFKIDKNKEERKRIDKLIKELQKEIEKEKSKTTHAGFEKEAIQLAKWDPYDQNTSSLFFDSEWMFDVKDGFDIVIGNPPYINIKSQSQETKEILKSRYKYSKGADIYVGFIEKSISMLKPSAIVYLIVPNKFFGADYGKLLRKYLECDNIKIKTIWDLKDEKVFENAQISTIVIGILKSKSSNPTLLIQGENKFHINKLFDSDGKIQIEASIEDNIILEKIKLQTNLSKLAKIRTGIMGFEYWKMEPIIHNGFKENCVRLYTNGNLSRYSDNWEDSKIKLYKDEYYKPTIELNPAYLNSNTIALFKKKPKIIVRGVSKELAGIIDYEGSGLLVAVHSIIPISLDIKYLLALINSNLLNWFHLNTIYSIRIPQGSLKYPTSFFESLPIAIAEEVISNRIIYFVTEILDIENKHSNLEVIQLERRINELVYKIYKLTYSEIKLIDPDFWLSAEEYENIDKRTMTLNI